RVSILKDQFVAPSSVAIVLFWFLTLARACVAGPHVELVESKPVETILDEPSIRDTRVVWLEMIAGARHNLDIAAFYILDRAGEPMEPVLQAIDLAAKRGVQVRILGDSIFASKYPDTLARLAKSGVSVRKIPINTISGGVMHAKYFIVDGQDVFLGSQNFDWKAIKHIHEIGIRVRDAAFGASVEALFNLDWKIAVATARARKALLARRVNVLSEAHPLVAKIGGREVRLSPAFSPRILNQPGMDWEEERLVALMGNAKKEILVQVLEYSVIDQHRLY